MIIFNLSFAVIFAYWAGRAYHNEASSLRHNAYVVASLLNFFSAYLALK